MTADVVRAEIAARADAARATGMARFFKTGPGDYGAGDVFAGISMPELRRIAKGHRDLDLADITHLLGDATHEHRMVALLVLVGQYATAAKERAGAGSRRCADIVALYLAQTARINNWDLVDASAEFIVGPEWRTQGPNGRRARLKLISSNSLWERRIAVLSTFHDIKVGESTPALEVCALLLRDREDLIHKATGWMLREVGKRVNRDDLLGFLDEHAAVMPRTMLRYAIEHLDPDLRRHYLDAATR